MQAKFYPIIANITRHTIAGNNISLRLNNIFGLVALKNIIKN
jgi:hypothetical protein